MSDSPLEPLTPDPFRGEAARPANDRAPLPRQRAQLRILVVEEAASMRRILHNLLEEIGCGQISEAADGATALTELHNRRFDMVISELLMTGMSGLALLRAIRADRNLRQIPVLMVSAQAQREHILAAAEAGVNAYLLKPFTAAMLESKINAIFHSLQAPR